MELDLCCETAASARSARWPSVVPPVWAEGFEHGVLVCMFSALRSAGCFIGMKYPVSQTQVLSSSLPDVPIRILSLRTFGFPSFGCLKFKNAFFFFSPVCCSYFKIKFKKKGSLDTWFNVPLDAASPLFAI